MKLTRAILPAVLAPVFSLTARAGVESAATNPGAPAPAGTDLLTGEGVSLGGVLFPHIHFSTVYGRTSLEGGHEAGAGHHDPVVDGWTVQGLELGISGRFGDHVEAFGTWHGYWENEAPRAFDSEFEEYFLRLKDLPGGFELRGGRFLNRFGLHNATHLHGWSWADNYLVSGRFLGDDGLSTTGGEISWKVPLPWTSVLNFSAGDVKSEAHEHGEEEEEGAEPLFEGEGAAFADRVYSANWTNLWNYNDFHQWRFGLSAAWGDNAWGRSTRVFGLHGQYEWRKNGFSPGGPYFRWTVEAMLRDADAMTGHLPGEEEHEGEDHADEEPSVRGSFSEWGVYTSATVGMDAGPGILEAAMRYEYLDGAPEAGLPGRHRFGPGLTFYANSRRTAFVRGQMNFDRIDGMDSGTSVWFSAGFNWGGAEVR